jgi:hypothetical protein
MGLHAAAKLCIGQSIWFVERFIGFLEASTSLAILLQNQWELPTSGWVQLESQLGQLQIL